MRTTLSTYPDKAFDLSGTLDSRHAVFDDEGNLYLDVMVKGKRKYLRLAVDDETLRGLEFTIAAESTFREAGNELS